MTGNREEVRVGKGAGIALDDPLRIEAVLRAGFGLAPRAELDVLTERAAQALRAPTAAVTLLSGTQQFFFSHFGLPEPIALRRETSVGDSFCRQVVLRGRPFQVHDARRDPFFFGSPLVMEHGMRSYAGVPLHSADGLVVGAFCVVDYRPRAWTMLELRTLETFGRLASQELERRTPGAGMHGAA